MIDLTLDGCSNRARYSSKSHTLSEETLQTFDTSTESCEENTEAAGRSLEKLQYANSPRGSRMKISHKPLKDASHLKHFVPTRNRSPTFEEDEDLPDLESAAFDGQLSTERHDSPTLSQVTEETEMSAFKSPLDGSAAVDNVRQDFDDNERSRDEFNMPCLQSSGPTFSQKKVSCDTSR